MKRIQNVCAVPIKIIAMSSVSKLPTTELRPWRPISVSRSLLFLGSFALLTIYILSDLSLPGILYSRGLDVAIITRQASVSVLEVFQVHEPVFTPAGTSDQYGCVYTEVLMEHSFAFSYGVPFVGKPASALAPCLVVYLIPQLRAIHSTTLRLQPSNHQFHCSIRRTPIRPSGLDVSRGRRSLSYFNRRTYSKRHSMDIHQRNGSIQCPMGNRPEDHLRLGKSHRQYLHRSF